MSFFALNWYGNLQLKKSNFYYLRIWIVIHLKHIMALLISNMPAGPYLSWNIFPSLLPSTSLRTTLIYDLFLNINQLDALNFIISLFQASTCFDHMSSKHVEAWNKLIVKFSASIWLVLRNKYTEMHGQQNTGLSKKMDGIWNRYNLKSTGRTYTFGVLKCSEKFKVLDLP